MVDSASIRWFESVNDARQAFIESVGNVRTFHYKKRFVPAPKSTGSKNGNRTGIIFMLCIITPFHHDKRL